MLGASEGFGVLFDGEDLRPAIGHGKGDGVAASARKCIDEDGLVGWGGCDMFGDLAARAVLVG